MLNEPIRYVGKIVEFDSLEGFKKDLLRKALEAADNAFCPASGFCVGASVWIPEEKKIITGANYECSSFGGTMCGDRTAVFAANALGYTNITHMGLVTKFKDGRATKDGGSPCGLCRQVIYDAARRAGNDIEIITASTNFDVVRVTSIYELLPMPFSFDDFGVDTSKFNKK